MSKKKKQPRKTPAEARCIACAHFDIDTNRCAHSGGLLRHVKDISESMAEAVHNCTEYVELVFSLAPKGCLDLALKEVGISLDEEELGIVFDKFEQSMIDSGNLEIKDEP